MTDYKKLITDNKDKFVDEDNLIDFIDNYIDKDGDNLLDLDDQIGEYADGLVPIYYSEITEEWANNNDCHGLTKEIQGEYGQDDIYKMMSSDLFYFYDQRLREDYHTLHELIDEQGEPETEDINQ
jgi:hypothetical protein